MLAQKNKNKTIEREVSDKFVYTTKCDKSREKWTFEWVERAFTERILLWINSFNWLPRNIDCSVEKIPRTHVKICPILEYIFPILKYIC